MAAARKADVVVVGAGPGGYVAAIRLAQLGRSVLLVDRDKLGGTCLHYGCIPSKALIHVATVYQEIREAEAFGITCSDVRLDPVRWQAWKSDILKRLHQGIGMLLKHNRVEHLAGSARFTGPRRLEVKTSSDTLEIDADAVLLAAGGRPVELPGFPFDGERIVSSREALDWTSLPKHLVLIGGGVIGLEIGTFYAKLGCPVTVVEKLPQILPGVDPELVQVVARNLKRFKVAIHTSSTCRVAERTAGGVRLAVEDPAGAATLEADRVLVAVGVRPATDSLGLDAGGVDRDPRGFVRVDRSLRTRAEGVWAIGDLVGPPLLAHKASREALVAAESIAGGGAVLDYRAMPLTIFSDPEIGIVGPTEEEARKTGRAVVSGRCPFAACGRALISGRGEGFAKIVADADTHEVLGVHIVGPEASNLAGEAAVAVEMGATLEDIAHTVHAHPSLPEVLLEAAEAALGRAIHIPNPRPR